MVANPRQERPRTADPLVNELAGMRRELGELSRRGATALWDGNSADVVAVDSAAGWGLKTPIMDAVMYPDTPDAPTVTTGVWTTLWHTYFRVQHPRLSFSAILATKGASSVAGQMQWIITTTTAGAVTTSPSATVTGVGSYQDIQLYDFAEGDQNTLATVQLQVQMSGTVAGGNYAYAIPLWMWRVGSTFTN